MQTCNVSVRSILSVALCGAISLQPFAYGQQSTPPPADNKPAESKPAAPPSSYPSRAPGDPAKIAKGKQVFSANCSFCHGSDARGGEVGPNLVRSQIVLDDKNGELITPIVKNGVPSRGMPPITIDAEAIEDVVQFLHSLQNVQRGMTTGDIPLDILVGDASAGKTYFDGNCIGCHSTTGDLAGVGGKHAAKALQNLVVSGGGAGRRNAESHVPPTMATVTLASGEKFEGQLVRRDAFFISILSKDGDRRTFSLQNTKTKVDIRNPLQAHLDMLPKWKDSDIHNVTRYLAELK